MLKNKSFFVLPLLLLCLLTNVIIFLNFSRLDLSFLNQNPKQNDHQLKIIEETKLQHIKNNLTYTTDIFKSLKILRDHSTRFNRLTLLSFVNAYQTELNQFNHTSQQINVLTINTQNILKIISSSRLDIY